MRAFFLLWTGFWVLFPAVVYGAPGEKPEGKKEEGDARAPAEECALLSWGMKCSLPEGWKVSGAGPNTLVLQQSGVKEEEAAVITVVVLVEEDPEAAIKGILGQFSPAPTPVEEEGAALPLNKERARAKSYKLKGKDKEVLMRVFGVSDPGAGTSAIIFGLAPDKSFSEMAKAVDSVGATISLGDVIMNVGAMLLFVGEWEKVKGEGETERITFDGAGNYERVVKGKKHTGRFAIIESLLILRESTGETLHIPVAAPGKDEIVLGQMTFKRKGQGQ